MRSLSESVDGKDAMSSKQASAAHSRRISSQNLPPSAAFPIGALAGTTLFVWIHQFLGSFGVSVPVTAALTLAMALGAAAFGWGRTCFADSIAGLSHRSLAWLLLAV